MPEKVVPGLLKWTMEGGQAKAWVSHEKSRGGWTAEMEVSRHQIAPELHDRIDEEIEVDVDVFGGGHPRRIRRRGQGWAESPAAAPAPAPTATASGQAGDGRGKPDRTDRAQSGGGHGGAGGHGRRDRAGKPGEDRMNGLRFHNPYNFVPTPDRPTSGPLADAGADPEAAGIPGHGRYLPGRWSGRITVQMTAVTPLLLPDAARAAEDEHNHKTFPVRRGPDGRPYIPPTAVKGMLRAAYEAVTNSRFGVFTGHGDPLAVRMPANDGLRMVPVRIEGGSAQPCLGFNTGLPKQTQKDRWQPPGQLMYAAWVPAYGARNVTPLPNIAAFRHGQPVVAWVEKWERHAPRKDGSDMQLTCRYYRVLSMADAGEEAALRAKAVRQSPPAPPDADRLRGENNGRLPRSHHCPTGEDPQVITGWYCQTGRNMNNKKFERLFFNDPDVDPEMLPAPLAISKRDKTAWRQLVENYQTTHRTEIENGITKPPALDDDRCTWSRHLSDRTTWEQEATLGDGTLCYAILDGTARAARIVGLYPVMIGRRLFEHPPQDFLDDALKPATSLSELSPADRVFGWVAQETDKPGHTERLRAYKGNLRVGPVALADAGDHPVNRTPVETFDGAGLPLAILGQPKPQQGRFYLGNPDGTPQQAGITAEAAGYTKSQGGKRLRGRKVYPHHFGVEDIGTYWVDRNGAAAAMDRPRPEPVRANTARFREYIRPAPTPGTDELQRNDQNRSVQGWVKPAVSFTVDLHVTNLSPAELGALVYLLDLPEQHYHRFGGGKPLGFGSVRLGVAAVDLRTGEAEAARYAGFGIAADPPGDIAAVADAATLARLKRPFETALGAAAGALPHIRAFLNAARGLGADDCPVHYPRAAEVPQGESATAHPPPLAKGENFKWFQENERHANTRPRPGRPLPDLAAASVPALPVYETEVKDNRKGGRKGGRGPAGGRG